MCRRIETSNGSIPAVSLLALLAMVTLVLKSLLHWKTAQQVAPEEIGYTGD
jgi:ABC-type sulfate transport system permease subunit